jgi:hypothetical protein
VVNEVAFLPREDDARTYIAEGFNGEKGAHYFVPEVFQLTNGQRRRNIVETDST